jgi:hypothetical protein
VEGGCVEGVGLVVGVGVLVVATGEVELGGGPLWPPEPEVEVELGLDGTLPPRSAVDDEGACRWPAGC